MVVVGFADLPVEVILAVLKWLTCHDICLLAQTCRFFNRICQQDVTWRYLCLKEYGVICFEEWNVDSALELYKNVLYQYGYLIGDWQVNLTPYGGYFTVKVEPGRIVGYLCLPSQSQSFHLRKIQAFELKMKDMKCICNCLCGNAVPHLGELQNNPPSKFTFKCLHQANYEPVEMPRRYSEILRNLKCEKLQWPDRVITQLPLEPGLFQGDYGPHGIELIMVDITAENEIIGTKITGDPNIPAKKISFKAYINREVSLDELKALHAVYEDDDNDEENGQNQLVSLSEFQPPNHFYMEENLFSTKVLARYHSLGQIADDGYVDPEWTPCHFIVFVGNVFGILWLHPQLQDLTVYYPVKR